MLSYDQCKKLEEAGFPQEWGLTVRHRFVGGDPGAGGKIKATAEGLFIPTLPELIFACGKYICLLQTKDGWTAYWSKEEFESPVGLDAIDTFMVKSESGRDQHEAVYKLLLKIYESRKNKNNR